MNNDYKRNVFRCSIKFKKKEIKHANSLVSFCTSFFKLLIGSHIKIRHFWCLTMDYLRFTRTVFNSNLLRLMCMVLELVVMAERKIVFRRYNIRGCNIPLKWIAHAFKAYNLAEVVKSFEEIYVLIEPTYTKWLWRNNNLILKWMH